MTEPPSAPEKSENDAHREALFQARKRALFAIGGTFVVAIAVIAYLRTCDDIASSDTCKTTHDCDGWLGVECLHAPTSTYCTHSCDRDEDCDTGFHCESPPWEKNMTEGNPSHAATRTLCLKNIAPPAN